jgi:hypothetical protein
MFRISFVAHSSILIEGIDDYDALNNFKNLHESELVLAIEDSCEIEHTGIVEAW